MKFIVWTTFNTLHEEEEELSCMPPHVAIDVSPCGILMYSDKEKIVVFPVI